MSMLISLKAYNDNDYGDNLANLMWEEHGDILMQDLTTWGQPCDTKCPKNVVTQPCFDQKSPCFDQKSPCFDQKSPCLDQKSPCFDVTEI